MENSIGGRAPTKVLFGHTPKAAGSHLIEYFRHELKYSMLRSDGQFDNGVWRDFTIEQLLERIDAADGFLCSHVLAAGWSELVELIPFAGEERIIETIRTFRSKGWFTFSFVRHPGELLVSFYHYILDAHDRGWHDSVALHTPAVGKSLEEFVAEHCDKELLPAYWREYDYVHEASDANFRTFFARYFGHVFRPGRSERHASGSRGYADYCRNGELSKSTQTRIECSSNFRIYREILAARDAG